MFHQPVPNRISFINVWTDMGERKPERDRKRKRKTENVQVYSALFSIYSTATVNKTYNNLKVSKSWILPNHMVNN